MTASSQSSGEAAGERSCWNGSGDVFDALEGISEAAMTVGFALMSSGMTTSRTSDGDDFKYARRGLVTPRPHFPGFGRTADEIGISASDSRFFEIPTPDSLLPSNEPQRPSAASWPSDQA
jgi:hypothetical protein